MLKVITTEASTNDYSKMTKIYIERIVPLLTELWMEFCGRLTA